jgi:hypothetical protein
MDRGAVIGLSVYGALALILIFGPGPVRAFIIQLLIIATIVGVALGPGSDSDNG